MLLDNAIEVVNYPVTFFHTLSICSESTSYTFEPNQHHLTNNSTLITSQMSASTTPCRCIRPVRLLYNLHLIASRYPADALADSLRSKCTIWVLIDFIIVPIF